MVFAKAIARGALALSLVVAPAVGGMVGAAGAALAGCVHRSLDAASVSTSDVAAVLTGSRSDDSTEYAIVTGALGRKPQRWALPTGLGDLGAATCALGLGVIRARFVRSVTSSGDTPGTVLLTARSSDGGAAAALVECSR